MSDAFSLGSPFEDELSPLRRKQMIAQRLLEQSQTAPQGQMVSGHYVGPGIAGVLAPLVQSFLAKNMQGEVDAGLKEVRGRYNNAVADGLGTYFDQRDGKAGGVLNDQQADRLMNDDVAPANIPDPIKANPRRAAIEALTSGLAPLEALGKQDLAGLGKGTMTQADYLKLPGYDPQSRIAAALSQDLNKLTPEQKEHVVGGQIVTRAPNGYQVSFDGREKFGDVGTVGTGSDGTPILGQKNLGTGEAKFAPKGVSVTVDNVGNKGATKFSEEIGTTRAKVLKESFDKAGLASNALRALDDAGNELNAGVKSGITGEVSLALAKMGKALGLGDDPAIANTESFRANMAREVANMVKQFGAGTGISNADREFAEKAAGGTITLDDVSMARLVNIAKTSAANTVVGHNRLLSQQRRGSGANDADLDVFEVPFNFNGGDAIGYDQGSRFFKLNGGGVAGGSPRPAASGKTPSTAVPSLAEYMKSKGLQ